jgi:hypothetical protein
VYQPIVADATEFGTTTAFVIVMSSHFKSRFGKIWRFAQERLALCQKLTDCYKLLVSCRQSFPLSIAFGRKLIRFVFAEIWKLK